MAFGADHIKTRKAMELLELIVLRPARLEIEYAENRDTGCYVVDEIGKDCFKFRDVWRSRPAGRPVDEIRVRLAQWTPG